MSFMESIRQALDSLKTNKLRTILTMLGIVMGIFSVVAIISIGNSAKVYLGAELEKLGANSITIQGVNQDSKLKLEDMEIIKMAAPEIKSIDANISGASTIAIDGEDSNVIYTGVTSQYKNFVPIDMLYGRFINDVDIEYATNTVVIDESGANKIFKRKNVIGEEIELKDMMSGKNIRYKVIGVTKSGNSLYGDMMGSLFPVTAYIPITTTLNIQDRKNVDAISVMVETEKDLATVGNRITRALKFKNGNDKKYYSTSSADMQKSMQGIISVISGIFLVIAIITLVVGGIGIVNILLVSVTERIREIGIRKALGAQKKDIIMQFLSESIIITLISGLIGIGIGVIIGTIISNYLKIPPVVDFKTIILTILGSILLGLIFGVYPAKKASDLDPIESLRYE